MVRAWNLQPHESVEQAADGYASKIQVMPDPFTSELLNVGIAITDANGFRWAKVIDYPGRLKCLYGDEQSAMLVALAQHAADAYLNESAMPSINIMLSAPQPFYNMNPEVALKTLFRDQVTVAIPQKEKNFRQKQKKTAILRADVYRLIRERQVISHVIPDRVKRVLKTDKGEREIEIPLEAADGIAGLESADYSSGTVKVRLLDALFDLQFAARVDTKVKRLGLFIARSNAATVKDQQRAIDIDNIIDAISGRVPDNCVVEVESNAAKLTDKILDWADKKAA